MLRPVRTSAPAPLVDLDEIKRHAVVDFSDDDALLTGLVQAATDYLDGWSGVLGRCLVSQGWRQDFGCWPACGEAKLPFPDVTDVVISYSDAADQEQTVSDTLYEIRSDARGAFVRFTGAFSAPALNDQRSDAVRVGFVAGFGVPAEVPFPLKLAVTMLAAHWYHNREAVSLDGTASPVPMGVDMLIAPYRRVGV